jgi:cyclin H
MDQSPILIMLTCVWLACKTEEFNYEAEKLINIPALKGQPINVDSILNLEMILLEGISFHLRIYHPYRALKGFLDDIRIVCEISNTNLKLLDTLKTNSYTWIELIYLTDAPFLFSHSQLAFGALWQSEQQIGCTIVKQYFDQKFGMTPEAIVNKKIIK